MQRTFRQHNAAVTLKLLHPVSKTPVLPKITTTDFDVAVLMHFKLQSTIKPATMPGRVQAPIERIRTAGVSLSQVRPWKGLASKVGIEPTTVRLIV